MSTPSTESHQHASRMHKAGNKQAKFTSIYFWLLILLTVSHIFMLQQFSMVISHWSPPDGLGRHVRGVTLLFTIMRFLTRGLLRSSNTFLVRTAITSIRTRHRASKAKSMWSRFHSTSNEATLSVSEQLQNKINSI